MQSYEDENCFFCNLGLPKNKIEYNESKINFVDRIRSYGSAYGL